ncbi:MAG: glycosyltransferase family 4 protein [Chloroflexi bacterium]|nr:glycosyltransferase family 4 protein [Chloroflexota bacterium]
MTYVGLPLNPHSGTGQYEQQLLRALGSRVTPERIGSRQGKKVLGRDLSALLPVLAPAPGGELAHVLSSHLHRALPRSGRTWQALPIVTTVHDLGALYCRYDRAHSTLLDRTLFRMALLLMRRQSQLILTPSQFTKDTLVRRLGWTDKQVQVTPEGPTVSRVWGKAEAVARLAPVIGSEAESEAITLLNVGSELPRKRIPLLLDALADAQRLGVKLRLWRVGRAGSERWRRLSLTALQQHPNLPVRFFDGVSGDLLPAFYAAADLYVTTSAYEGFSLPTLDAMVSRTPVIATSGTALVELVGGAGLLVGNESPAGFAEAIVQLATNPAQRAELAEAGAQRSATFTWKQCAATTFEAYQRVLHATGHV